MDNTDEVELQNDLESTASASETLGSSYHTPDLISTFYGGAPPTNLMFKHTILHLVNYIFIK